MARKSSNNTGFDSCPQWLNLRIWVFPNFDLQHCWKQNQWEKFLKAGKFLGLTFGPFDALFLLSIHFLRWVLWADLCSSQIYILKPLSLLSQNMIVLGDRDFKAQNLNGIIRMDPNPLWLVFLQKENKDTQ